MPNRLKSESGQILFLFAAIFPVIMLFVMLMVDFGGAALTYHRAQVAADSAAYAAAQGVYIHLFSQLNEVLLDPGLAAGLASQYGTAISRGRLHIVQFAVQDDRVWIVGEMEYPTLFARVIGLSVIRVRVISSASPAFGIDTRGQ